TISTVISITLFLLVAVFALFETEMFLTAVSRHGDPNEILTFTGRTFIWPAVIEKILDQPLFGYGLGVTSIALPELSYVIGYTPAHAHNLVLQATFSLGLIGGGMCVLLLIFNFLVKKPNKLAISFTVYILVTSIPESSFLGGVAGYSIIPFLLMCIIKNENDYSYNRRFIE
ncbi:O-antigen ligase family protein, partial [Vibrio sinaloensis]|uniref:O-antigen ligase family protein n=1 Tax=Photobacterium sp. (strain ATCC 43367) TaxID=379097 RepID=UPI002F42B66E